MPEKDFETLGRHLTEAAEAGDEHAQEVLRRLEQYQGDPADDSLDWLNEAAIRWESEHPELARVAVRIINTLTSGGF